MGSPLRPRKLKLNPKPHLNHQLRFRFFKVDHPTKDFYLSATPILSNLLKFVINYINPDTMARKAFHPRFLTKRCSSLSRDELEKFSKLFSENYGVWSGKDEASRKGQPIKMPVSMYEKLTEQPEMFVSYCVNGNDLIGQAFFLNKVLPDGKKITWVTQLVVHRSYRNRKIGKRLLRSAWGFSNYLGWGLATANAITIKTLESVTWRKVNPEVIQSHLDEIRTLCDNIWFTKDAPIKISKNSSQIFTNFYPMFEKIDKQAEEIYVARLGEIEDGCEWLAFTFQEQPFDSSDRMNEMLDFSAEQLEDAYSRMEMKSQPWTRHTKAEVDFIEKALGLEKNDKILDIGCGVGRHTIELARRGYNPVGIDFSERLVKEAEKQAAEQNLSVHFYNRDARYGTIPGKFHKILCVYDVIGSFRTLDENKALIRKIWDKLFDGGKAIVSVMNMELTRELAKNRANVSENPSVLLSLPAGNIMQKTGDIFNPEHFILDEDAHLVYRKEQFEFDGELSAEYVIADYRFTAEELSGLFSQQGFNILDCRYVRAGEWDVSLGAVDPKAKEILLVVEKPRK